MSTAETLSTILGFKFVGIRKKTRLFRFSNTCFRFSTVAINWKFFCSIVHFSVPASDCRPIDVQTKLSNLESKARSKSCFSKTTWLELQYGSHFKQQLACNRSESAKARWEPKLNWLSFKKNCRVVLEVDQATGWTYMLEASNRIHLPMGLF